MQKLFYSVLRVNSHIAFKRVLIWICEPPQDLDSRYQALLQMYGEKVEETEELRLDLQDVKEMYKAQVSSHW